MTLFVLIVLVGIGGTASGSQDEKITGTKHLTDLEPLDIGITVPWDTFLVEEIVINESGIDWIDFHHELGFGVLENFIPSDACDDLMFLEPISSSVFTNWKLTEDTIDWYGGLVPDQDTVVFDFYISYVADCPFTLREQPSPVPEPATMVLFGTGLVGLVGIRKKLRKS